MKGPLHVFVSPPVIGAGVLAVIGFCVATLISERSAESQKKVVRERIRAAETAESAKEIAKKWDRRSRIFHAEIELRQAVGEEAMHKMRLDQVSRKVVSAEMHLAEATTPGLSALAERNLKTADAEKDEFLKKWRELSDRVERCKEALRRAEDVDSHAEE